MAISNIKATFSHDIKKVWNTVTSLKDYLWRSDISRIEVLEEGKKFIEHTKSGYSTIFTITAFEPYKRYEFDMENDNIIGSWSGLFSYEDGNTTIDFTENVTSKKIIMKPFIGIYLKRQQDSYIKDLKRVLEER